jgi:multiple sugar transport system substrate-binding protein
LLLDITDRFNKDFPVEDYIPLARTIQTVNGRVYGLNACMVCPLVLYNKDVFDAAGEPYPSTTKIWTIDEFRAVAKRLTRGDTWGVYGLDSRLMLEAFFSSAGGAVYNADYSQSTFNNPQVKRVLETIKAIREVDKTMPYSSTLENAGINTYQMLQTGKVAMLIDGSWSVMRLGQDLKLGIAPLPSFGKPLTVGQAHMHSIARNGRHPDESWEFIKFLADVKGYSGLLLREGLWLPNRFSQWADGPNGIDAWYNAGRYGNYYREMRDYLMAALVQPDAMVYTGEQNDIQSEELSLYFNDNKAIDKVLSDTQSRINDVIAQMK